MIGIPLTMPLAPLIGRAADTDVVCGLLRRDDVPLVTLSGPSGVGKTRLALHVAAQHASEFMDGVRVVELAAFRDPGLVMPAIAHAIGVREDTSSPLLETIAAHLQRRQLLLVLDNLEQVVDCASQIAVLLALCPQLKVLATSRLTLRLSEEYNVQVEPLATPASVELFVSRARGVAPAFRLTSKNRGTIAAICARLDGLPLAIELAAAQIRAQSPRALLAQLDRMLPLLEGAPDQVGRHRTMRDAIAWSYDLLDEAAQLLFRRLAVFAGGFDLESARAVASGNQVLDIFEGIHSLVENNLIQPADSRDVASPRYRMLETVREFGLDQLEAHHEERAVREASATYFAGLAGRTSFDMFTHEYARIIEQLDLEHANVQAVLGWALASGAHDLGLEMAAAMGPYWIFRGNYRDGRTWITRFLAEVPSEKTEARARALVRAGWLANLQGDLATADNLLTEGVDVARCSGERNMAAQGSLALSLVKLQQRDYARASAQADASFNRYLALDPGNANFDYWASMALTVLGQIAALDGRTELAEQYRKDAVQRLRVLPFAWALGPSIRVLGDLASDAGEPEWALAYYRESIQLAQEHDDQRLLAEAISGMASLAFFRGAPVQAARLYGAVAALREREGITEGWDLQEHNRRVASVEAALSPERFDGAWTSGEEMTLAEVVAITLRDDVLPAALAAMQLTGREIDVLRLLAKGYSNRQIGDALDISPRTAGDHVGRVLAKLGVETRTAAATFAVRQGLS